MKFVSFIFEAPATEACGYIEVFVRTFAQYTPWQKGNRHESMLALGRSARRKGFSKEELEKLTSVMTVKIVGDGYSLQELRKDLSSGYQYADLSYTPSPEAELLSPLSTVTYAPIPVDIEAEKRGEVSIKNNELRASSPCIPDEVYDRLPDFLKEAVATDFTPSTTACSSLPHCRETIARPTCCDPISGSVQFWKVFRRHLLTKSLRRKHCHLVSVKAVFAHT